MPWLLKGEEHEHHRADEEYEELLRDLRQSVKQQPQAALGNRFAGEVALHLRLIATEVSQGQEHSADKAAPDVVSVVPIEMRGHGIQSSRGAG